MAYKPKKISLARSKRMFRRVDTTTFGTHSSAPPRGSRGSNGSRVKFSSPRKNTRAQRGIVDQVLPRTTSRESESDYTKRVSRQHYTLGVQRKARTKGIIIAVAVVLAIVCAAGGVGVAAYFESVSSKMSLGDSNVSAALVAPIANKPYNVLLVGEFTQAGRPYEGPDMLMLARVDTVKKQVTLVSIPSNLQVTLNDGKVHRLSDAQLMGGDAYLTSTVADVAGASISHLIKADNGGLTALVDALGGVSVDVLEEVDDPAAGGVYIPAGTQVLDGQAALTFCRATNYLAGAELRSANQRSFALALAEKILDTNALSVIPMLDTIAGTLRTDYSANDALSLIGAMRGFDLTQAYSVEMPGYDTTSTSNGTKYFVLADAEWDAMMKAVAEGKDPTPTKLVSVDIDLASFKITVRNGTSITGAANQIVDVLKAKGFTVADVGNADSPVYEETLVVYKDAAQQAAAEAVVRELGVGRAIASNGSYAFETEVLVMLGSDWKPLN